MLIRLFLIVIILFAATLPADALFRRHAHAAATQHHSTVRKGRSLKFPTPLQRSNSTNESYAAFVGFIAALVCFGALALTGMGLFLIPMFAFAAFAIVMGCFGIHRMKRGFALAGMLGGFLCLVGGFIALAML
jgi:hypothetical protein